MAFWNTVKKVAIATKCATGWHAGEWSPIPGKPKCQVEKTCPDCNKHVTSTKHNYGDWRYVDYLSCNSIRECVYCGSLEQKVIHQYIKAGKDGNCRIIEKCSRCGDQQLGREDHNWIKLFDHEVRVGGKRKCKDCGKFES